MKVRDIDLLDASHVYMVGIKGTGMTALAQVLASRGIRLSGSDVSDTFPTDAILARIGADVGPFDAGRIDASVDFVVRSAAYDLSQEELVYAKNLGLRILTYPEALGEIMSQGEGVGVIGTHGKTTCTGMLGHVLVETGLDPTVLVGSGVVNFGGDYARIGKSSMIVGELCEYRRHFLHSAPGRVLLTNIDLDHVDAFEDLSAMEKAYELFLMGMPETSLVIYCADSPSCERVLNKEQVRAKGHRLISYGTDDRAMYRLVSREVLGNGFQEGEVFFNGSSLGVIETQLFGEHNMVNACGVFALCHQMGLDLDAIKQALKEFKGTVRRMEPKGEINGVRWFDDYGHHPVEIKATLKGLREQFRDRQIWCVFQPHTYTRTKAFFEDFAGSFGQVDHVIISEIFASARELRDPDVTSEKLVDSISKQHTDARCILRKEDIAAYLEKELQPGDVLITMGAGVAYKVGELLMKTPA